MHHPAGNKVILLANNLRCKEFAITQNSSGVTPCQKARGVSALKQVVNNGGLFFAAEINVLTGQRSGAVIIKLPCAVGGALTPGGRRGKCVTGTRPYPNIHSLTRSADDEAV